jgi:hypothetical protein
MAKSLTFLRLQSGREGLGEVGEEAVRERELMDVERAGGSKGGGRAEIN